MTTFTHLTSLQAYFSNEYPRMQRYAGACFRHLDAERRDEAISNTIGIAWKSFYTLFRQGRATRQMLQTVLRYAVTQTKAGRTVQGADGRIAKCAIDYRNRGRLKFQWADLNGLIGRTTPVPEQVIFRLDVPKFLSVLKARQQRLAYDLAIGYTTSETAKRHGVTAGAISQFRQVFKRLYDTFFNE